MIYDCARIQMFLLHDKLVQEGATPCALNTDSIYFTSQRNDWDIVFKDHLVSNNHYEELVKSGVELQ